MILELIWLIGVPFVGYHRDMERHIISACKFEFNWWLIPLWWQIGEGRVASQFHFLSW